MLRGVPKAVNEFSHMTAAGMTGSIPANVPSAATCGVCP